MVTYGKRGFIDYLLDQARTLKRRVWIASGESTPAHSVNSHADRIGYYFPPDLVEDGCRRFGLRPNNGYVHGNADRAKKRSMEAYRERLLEIYPRMPERDQKTILAKFDPVKAEPW